MKQIPLPRIILAVFLVSIIWWFYLCFNTQPQLVHDALGYQQLGRLLQHEGFSAYLKQGPNREPIYPLLVSLAMHLEHASGIAYTRIMALFGILLLGLTQFLIYRTLLALNVRTGVTAAVLLYFGLSPAVNNTAFSLYSEIAAYPFMVGVVWANVHAFETIRRGKKYDALTAGALLGLSFVCMTFIKGMFEFIFLAFFAVYLVLTIMALFQKQKALLINCLIALTAFTITYEAPVLAYKTLNQQYNGQFALTNRGSWALYASCARRAEPLTKERFLTALAYVPGKGSCEQIYGVEKCYFWGIETLDAFGIGKREEMYRTTPPAEMDGKMMGLAKEKVLENPPQFFLLMVLDGIKMFFWESTKIGFVSYPPWLARLYDLGVLKNLLRLAVSLLTLGSFCYLGVSFLKQIRAICSMGITPPPATVMRFFIFILILTFAGFYALFMTIPRFALPLAPIYMAMIAIMLDDLFTYMFKMA